MSEFFAQGNPQNIPKVKGGDNMFFAASEEQVRQLHPELVDYEPEKSRCFYHYEDGSIRWFDRIYGWYFSDKEWGLETEYKVEGITQQWLPDYTSLNIRNSTIKAPDGWTEVSCDYSAEEIRLAAINTHGKTYLEAFREGKDVHLMTAIAMFGEEKVNENRKKYRSKAKGCNFGLGYGGSARVLERIAGMSPEDAKEAYDAFMDGMADHFMVQAKQVHATHQTMCEHSLFGFPVRLHRYYKSNSYKDVSAGERLAKNHRIQSTGADILSLAFMKIWKNIYQQLEHPEDYIRFNLTVHDEIDFYIKNEAIPILVPKIIENMIVQMPDWPIPVIVGLSMGPSLGQLYEWEYDTKENGYRVLTPALEEVKKKEPVVEVIEKPVEEEEITLEF